MEKNQQEKTSVNKNVKTYFLFLIFTAFLWFALQFSKNYSREVEFNIEYNKVESKKIVKTESDQQVRLMLEGSGFQLLKFYIFDRSLEIDVRRTITKTKTNNYLTGKKMIDLFQSSLNYNGTIAYSSKDTINIYFDEIVAKKVPLKINETIKYAAGFTSVKGAIPEKREIEISGPKSILDTIKYLTTETLSVSDLNKDFRTELKVDLSAYPDIVKTKKKKIKVDVGVDKLTEKEFTIPIEVLNIKKGERVQLFPKQVAVIFGVALKDYPSLQATDFKVTVDLKKSSSETNTLELELLKKPNNVYNARLSENEVQYIVIK